MWLGWIVCFVCRPRSSDWLHAELYFAQREGSNRLWLHDCVQVLYAISVICLLHFGAVLCCDADYKLNYSVLICLLLLVPGPYQCHFAVMIVYAVNKKILLLIITSPAGAVAKYCNERVCVCDCLSVCLSARIYPEWHARSLPHFLYMLPMAVAWSSSSRMMKYQGEGGILVVLFPTDSALYSVAFGTYTKIAEPIEMPFGWWHGWAIGTMC